MSARKTLTDAVVSALQTVTGVGLVTDRPEHWQKTAPQDYPALFVHDEVVNRTRIAYPSTAAAEHDMLAEMELSVEARAFDIKGKPDANLDLMLGRVETEMVTNATIAGLTQAVTPVSDETDEMAQKNVDRALARFTLLYTYNHANP